MHRWVVLSDQGLRAAQRLPFVAGQRPFGVPVTPLGDQALSRR
jgi:hypothetical protein